MKEEIGIKEFLMGLLLLSPLLFMILLSGCIDDGTPIFEIHGYLDSLTFTYGKAHLMLDNVSYEFNLKNKWTNIYIETDNVNNTNVIVRYTQISDWGTKNVLVDIIPKTLGFWNSEERFKYK